MTREVNDFLTLIKVKGMNSISLFSSFLFFNKLPQHCYTVLHLFDHYNYSTVCELQSLTLFCEHFAFTYHSLLIKTIN